MAEDCIRWEPTENGGVHTPRAGFEVHHDPLPDRGPWVLLWKDAFVRRFHASDEAKGCAEDILRIRYGLVSREDVESRYDIDLSPFLNEPLEVT
jgi:hypothetical protein